jgi:serine/threonine-protein kinase
MADGHGMAGGSARSARGTLIARLRERGVLRVAASYAVIAWLVLQIADVALEPWNVPAWVARAPLVIAALGFPIAIALAWFLELGDRGVSVDTADVGAARPLVHGFRRYADVGVISVLAAIVGWFVLRDAGWLGDAPRTRGVEVASLAVLPFANVSGAPEDAYLSAGLSDELRDQLSRFRSLAVSARSSSLAFEGENVDAPTIAEKLAVGALLEGTVRRDGERIRVSVQLVNGRDGKLLWSERYDRPRTDLLRVQDDVARTVAATILPKFVAVPESVGPRTEDPVAYDLYLLAHEYEREAGGSDEDAALHKARELYEAAIAANPEYAQAYARLAHVRLALGLPYDIPERIAAIDRTVGPLIERALELDPENSDAWMARGVLLRWTQRPGGGEAYRRAVEADPNNAEALQTLAVYEESIGRHDRTLEHAERARRLNPMSPNGHLMSVAAAVRLGLRERAFASVEGVQKQFPGTWEAAWTRCWLLQGLGDHAEALACAAMLAPGSGLRVLTPYMSAQELQSLMGDAWNCMGDGARAIEHYDRAGGGGPRYKALLMRRDTTGLQHLLAEAIGRPLLHGDWQIADTLARAGLRAEALRVYRTAEVDRIVETESNELHPAMSGLAQMIALLRAGGAAAEAERLLPAVLEYSERQLRSGARHYPARVLRAQALALAGRDEEALAEIRAAIDAPGAPFPSADLETDPVFDDLKNDPRFAAELARLRERQDALRARLPEVFRRNGLAWPPPASSMPPSVSGPAARGST